MLRQAWKPGALVENWLGKSFLLNNASETAQRSTLKAISKDIVKDARSHDVDRPDRRFFISS